MELRECWEQVAAKRDNRESKKYIYGIPKTFTLQPIILGFGCSVTYLWTPQTHIAHRCTYYFDYGLHRDVQLILFSRDSLSICLRKVG